MIAAAFLWPATWPLIWRQVAIALWGLGVVFLVERWLGCRSVHGTLAALGATRPNLMAVSLALVATLAMFLGPPILAATYGATWGLQPGWGLTLVGVILVNGLAEEAIHRAFLFRHLRVCFSYSTAAAIAAAAFAAQHLYVIAHIGVPAGLASIALALLLTFPFVCFYERGGRSILPPAILHTGSNASVLLLLAPMEQKSLVMLHMAVVLIALYGGMALLIRIQRTLSETDARLGNSGRTFASNLHFQSVEGPLPDTRNVSHSLLSRSASCREPISSQPCAVTPLESNPRARLASGNMTSNGSVVDSTLQLPGSSARS